MNSKTKSVSLALSLIFITAYSYAQPPTANFSADVTYGCAPLVVQFTDLSSGSPTSWFWDFGNSNTSVLQNPSVSYLIAGTYTITLIVSNTFSSDTLVKQFYILVFAPPISNFSADDTLGCAPFTVNFSDLSVPQSASLTQWYWSFGDGKYSTQQNPIHTYDLPGIYTVYLIVWDANGCQHFFFIDKYIKALDPQADFGYTVTCPTTVNFSDSSKSDIVNWKWYFGDGDSSIVPNPVHGYASTGTYNVILIVKDIAGCSDTIIKPVTINPFQVDFSYNVSCSPSGFTISFTDLSFPTPTSWYWDFGDGFTSTAQNPVHSYTTFQSYTIKLIASQGPVCKDTVTKNYQPVTALFSDSIYCSNPLRVNFFNASQGTGALKYFWDFGDSTTDTTMNPTHTYYWSDSIFFNGWYIGLNKVCSNTYGIRLTVNDAYGCSETYADSITVTKKPKVFFEAADSMYCSAWEELVGEKVYDYYEPSDTSGCVPLTVQFVDTSIVCNVVSWYWDFGNGFTSTLQNPAYTYTDTGHYTVKLVITNSMGCKDSVIKVNYIQAGIPPTFIDFTMEDTICHHSLLSFFDSVAFSDTSIKVTNRCWNFHYYSWYGDRFMPTYNGCDICPFPGQEVFDVHNTTAIIHNPIHDYDEYFWIEDTVSIGGEKWCITDLLFPAIGPDTIRFIAGYNGCNDTIIKTIFIHPPLAHPGYIFPESSCGALAACSAPATFGFFNGSYMWDTLLVYNIIHKQTGDTIIDFTNPYRPNDTTFITFTRAGNYAINIQVKNDSTNCIDTRYRELAIDSVRFGFKKNPSADCLNGNAFTFTDTSVSYFGEIKKWRWTFGDGDTLYSFMIVLTPYGLDTIWLSGTNAVTAPNNNNGYTFGTFVNPTHIYRDTGTYVVQLWIEVDVPYKAWGASRIDYHQCYYESFDTIRVEGIKAVFSVDDNIGCPGLTVQFTDMSFSTSSITNWQWDFGDASTDITQNPVHTFTNPGFYNVRLIVTDTNGCADSAEKIIRVTLPVSDFSAAPTTVCLGDSVYFINNSSSDTSVAYLWNFGDGQTDTATNPVHVYFISGTFTVLLIATDANGCSDTLIKNNYITVLPQPFAGFTADKIITDCPPLIVAFTDISSGGIVSWFWDFGDSATSTQQNPVHVYSASGNYNVILIVTNTLGCRDTIIKNQYIKIGGPFGTFSFAPDSGCVPLTVTFLANTINADYFLWDFGDGNVSFLPESAPGDSVVHTYMATGIFTPSLILRDSNACTYIVPSTNKVYIDGFVADFSYGDSVHCGSDSVTFFNLTTTTLPVTFLWDFGDASTSSLENPKHFYNTSGTYNITFTVMSMLGCSSSVTKKIILYKAPALSLSVPDTSGCLPLSLNFSATNSDTSVIVSSWQWNFGDGNAATGNPVSHTYTSVGTFNVLLKATYGNGYCEADTQITILTDGFPKADFSYNPSDPSIYNATVNFIDQSNGAVQWLWYFGTGASSTLQNPNYTYPTYGEYLVMLIVWNQAGCPDTILKPVYVAPDAFIDVPNAFTPNGDGVNDFFFAFHAGIVELLDFRIYNRWGELVFQTTDLNKGWDGTFRGSPQDLGTYVWYIKARTADSDKIILEKGSVSLIR